MPGVVVKNKHGVECIQDHFGMFGDISIPVICWGCSRIFEAPKDDLGDVFAPPECRNNVFFPTRKGSCKRQEHTCRPSIREWVFSSKDRQIQIVRCRGCGKWRKMIHLQAEHRTIWLELGESQEGYSFKAEEVVENNIG